MASAGTGASIASTQAWLASAATAPLVLPAAGAVGGLAMLATATATRQAEQRMVGMSRANAETCVGFTDRVSERLPDDIETWTYQRGDCALVITLKSGYVSGVQASAFTCGAALQRCL